MSNKAHLISYYIKSDQPTKARDEILSVIRKEKAHMGAAARSLGCAHGTLNVWIDKLGIRRTVDDLIEKARVEGWKRPPTPTEGVKMGRPFYPYEVVRTPRGRALKKFPTLAAARAYAAEIVAEGGKAIARKRSDQPGATASV